MLHASVAGLIGLMIGSFLNVCIYRLPLDLSIIAPRSFCPSCEKQIAWFDNIPVLTWLLLAGKCRHCGARIPIRYPVVEALTGGLFFLAIYYFGPTALGLKICAFAAIQIALVFTDLESRILPDEFTLGGLLAGLAFAVLAPMPQGLTSLLAPPEWSPRALSLLEAVTAAGIASGALWFTGFLYQKLRGREGLGLGDVKMVAMIGAFFGIQGTLLTLVLGSLLGSIVGVAFIFAARKEASSYELPFGTFLAIAALIMAYWGGPLLGWYGTLG